MTLTPIGTRTVNNILGRAKFPSLQDMQDSLHMRLLKATGNPGTELAANSQTQPVKHLARKLLELLSSPTAIAAKMADSNYHTVNGQWDPDCTNSANKLSEIARRQFASLFEPYLMSLETFLEGVALWAKVHGEKVPATVNA